MIQLTGENVDIEVTWAVSKGEVKVSLDPAARALMQKSRDYIEKALKNGEIIYGVNTGFGALSNVRISDADIEQLQKNLIRSHSAGVGDPFTVEETRAIMFLRANALARGHSGIRPLIVDCILEFLNQNLIPVVPQQGSVGASGDLAPLAHLALALIGEGELWENGQRVQAADVLKRKNIKPLQLQAKEGLSLINGCQVTTAVGLLNTYRARRLLWHSDLAGAMSLEALRGSRSAFDPLIAATRPHPGEAKTARNLMKLLGPTSQIAESHENCEKVQDAYSLRCMPAVHGAAKDTLRHVVRTLEVEANSSTDNPLVFADDKKVLSCGNFHGEPVAFVLDYMAIALSASASISECRIEKLINPNMSGLPAFLAPAGGLNSGFMMVEVAAAALVSENKILAHPASVDSIPTSADKEDHVSMGTIAARKLGSIVKNAENVLAMELLASAQALDLVKPLESASAVKAVHQLIRTKVPFAKEDRIFALDVQAVRDLIETDAVTKTVHKVVGALEW